MTFRPITNLINASLLALSLALPVAAQAPPAPPKDETTLAIEKALASDIRTPEERARDSSERKPIQTLGFFGLKPNMTVIELFPGAGWYTKVLGQVLPTRASCTSPLARPGPPPNSRNGSWTRSWRLIPK